jgi:hypothetical protein
MHLNTLPAAGLVVMSALLQGRVSGEVDFQRDIAPFFAEYCLECHGPDASKGGLNLTSLEGATKELKSGARGILPGDPDRSALVHRLTSSDVEEAMPPREKAKRPPPEAAALLREWIAAGAPWAEHWAFRRVERPPVPPGPAHPVDAFIGTRLAAEGIAPRPEADRWTLIKRLSYDLTGLPPAAEDAVQFVADASPDAYAELVDRLLASPHFGERWGRHWLDRARYADSDGYEKDSPRPDAWRYRDWVIRAVNRDLPFDQFTLQQLAGDLLPEADPEAHLATAFHRQTLTNREGGVDQEQFRVEAVFDRTETTATVWMGLTAGCARCHNHKYDRISQQEYYQLFAFFNDADESTARVSKSPEEMGAFEKEHAGVLKSLGELESKRRLAEERLRAGLASWAAEMAVQQRALAGSGEAVPAAAEITEVSARDEAGNPVGGFTRMEDGSWLAAKTDAAAEYALTVAPPPGIVSGLRLHLLTDDSLPGKGPGTARSGNFVLSDVMAECNGTPLRLHSAAVDFAQKGYPASAVLDEDPATGWAVSPRHGKSHVLTLQIANAVPDVPDRKLHMRLVQRYQGAAHRLGRFRLEVLTGATEAALLPKGALAAVRLDPGKWTAAHEKDMLDWLAASDPECRRIDAEIQALQLRAAEPPLMEVRVLSQRGNPRATRVFHRGEFLSPGETVEPGLPSVLPPLPDSQAGRANRLDLARWLVSRDHPLTSRVAVNQIWHHLFGQGLVRTVADFGVRGEKPSHPALLDWLAAEFMETGWSRKRLIRLIVTSAAYRRSSAGRPDLQERDPLNRLLARQNRVRVEGEIVRDLHLAVSGLLSRRIGGPSVFPDMPPEVAEVSYANNFKWVTSTGEDRWRRGLYTFFKRTAPHPDLMTFDCPDANIACVDRDVSNTPLQALTTLNATAFSAAAVALAERTLRGGGDDAAKLASVIRSVLIRPAREEETALLRRLLEQSRRFYQSHPEEAAALTKGSENSGPELAAWTVTVRSLLNTDEFITRE